MSTLINGKEQISEDLSAASVLYGCDHLEQESEEGNVEYKRQLIGTTEERFQKLVSQLKYRLAEGSGEALYEIGIEDDGFPRGLPEDQFRESIDTVIRMAAALGAEATIVCEKTVGEDGTRKVAEVLVRKHGEEDGYVDLTLAVCGNVDSGKSTLVGVLTRGVLDNGRGLARSLVFNHKHEIETGRTSSISQQIMGFDGKGTIVNYGITGTPSWADIVERSAKVATFIDLAGHEKYLKTTVFGMTGHVPDYAMIIVGSNMGVTRMTKEHIGLALALKIPFFVVVTKIDMCPENVLEETMESVLKILKLPGVRKLHYHVRTEDDVVVAAKNVQNDRVVPIFQISSVTGANMNLFRSFLNILPVRKHWEEFVDKPPEVLIDEVFFVTGVGVVVSGVVTSGSISVNDTLLLGPDGLGDYRKVSIKSIQNKRVSVKRAVAGQHASFALKKEKRAGIRKGMALLCPSLHPKPVWEFEAEVLVLYHSTTIKPNYQPVIHIMCVRQCAKILSMDRELLRTGDKSVVRFQFMFRPEYIKEGARLIFREGRTKGMGVISRVFHESTTPATAGAASGEGGGGGGGGGATADDSASASTKS